MYTHCYLRLPLSFLPGRAVYNAAGKVWVNLTVAHTCMYTRIHSYSHSHTPFHTHTHPFTHIHTHTLSHTHTRTHTHTHTHTHTQEHSGRVFRLQFDSFQIVSSSHDDSILIWDFLDLVPPSPMETEQSTSRKLSSS